MRVEIAHDALARKVYDKGSAEDKMLLRVIRLVQERYNAFTSTKTFLSRKELNFIEPFERGLGNLITEEEQIFLNRSSRFRRRQLIFTLSAIASVIVGLIIGILYMNMLRANARQAEENIFNQNEANKLVALAMQNEEVSPELSLKLVLAAKIFTPNNLSIDQLSRLIFRRNNFSNKNLTHRGAIYGVSFSPDGKTFATASMDKTIRIWNLEGKMLKALLGHNRMINSVDFSPDGTMLISASDDSTAILWNVETGDSIRVLRKHTYDVNDAKFSPDGTKILTASRDQTAILWSVEGDSLKTLRGHSNTLLDVSFSKDGNYVATAGRDSIAIVWNLNTGRELTRLRHFDSVYGVEFSPKSIKSLATCSSDEIIRLWNINMPTEPKKQYKGHAGLVVNIEFSPSGDTLASSSWDNTVRLWDVETERNVRTYVGHKDIVLGLAYSSDGNYLLSGGRDNVARLWNLRLKRNIKNFEPHTERVQSVALSPNGKLALSGSWDDQVILWDIETKSPKMTLKMSTDVEAVVFHPSGEAFGVAFGKNARVYNLKGDILYECKNGHFKTIKTIKFSNDGKYILTGGHDDKAILWDIQGKQIQEYVGHNSDILSVAMSPNTDTIVTSSWDQKIMLWTKEGELIRILNGHTDRIYAVDYSPIGGQVISADKGGTIRLWNTETGENINTYQTNNSLYSLKFVPDSPNLFVSAGADNQARLWDISGNILQVYEQPSDIYSVDINKDKTYLFTGTHDNGAGLFYTLEGFLQNNHFENITTEDKLEFGLINIKQVTISPTSDANDLEKLRKLAYYLEEKGERLNETPYYEKAKEIHDVIIKLSNATQYDFMQASTLYAKLALAKLIKSRSYAIEGEQLMDMASQLSPKNGEVILKFAHFRMIQGQDNEARFLYKKLKHLTYSRNNSMLIRAITELKDYYNSKLISKDRYAQMKINLEEWISK